MGKRRHYRRLSDEAPDLDITTFMNLMVVLVPFLLIGAVFSRVTVLNLNVPTAAGAATTVHPSFNIEVIVRKSGLELANGAQVVAALPKKDGQYDLQKLSTMLMRLKKDYPQKEDATVLMEPAIEYDYLIQVMDTVRQADVPTPGSDKAQKLTLFPKISIGDAP